jgi:sugar lactone lactonase YvrE
LTGFLLAAPCAKRPCVTSYFGSIQLEEETWMKFIRAAALVMATFSLPIVDAKSQETTVVTGIAGPEGPLYIDGNLYYVGWVSNTLEKWDGTKKTVLNMTPGCGHNGLAFTKQRTFFIACIDLGAVIEVDMNGKEIRRWEADKDGTPFIGGINDIVVGADGGAYATVFAPNGKVLYLAPGAQSWVQVAGDLSYANGIGISPNHKHLYVDETVGNSVKEFDITDDGHLTNRTNFALLNLLVKDKNESRWLGPDSMKIDAQGNIYVAQWLGGKVLKISPEGKLLHIWDIAAGDGTTNVAFGPDGNFYVTVVKDPYDPKAMGSIVKVPDVR